MKDFGSWWRRRLDRFRERPPAEAPRRFLRTTLVLDVLAVVALLALPFLAWAREGVTYVPGKPWWIFDSDQYLYGPDAAAWAQNALALHQGRLLDLDPHRMPTWTLFTVGFMRLFDVDVALAGHLVNRIEHMLLGPVLYVLARMVGARSLAFAAGALVVIQPHLLASACRFGVDPTVTFMVPLLLLLAWLAGKSWWLAPFAGAVAALTMVSHLTALGFPLCGLLLLLFSGKGWWRRILAVLLYVGTAYLVLRWVFSVFPVLPDEFFRNALAEGIAPTGEDSGNASRQASRASALATLRDNAPVALDAVLRFIAHTFAPVGVPWALCVAFIWLGFLGPDAVRGQQPPAGTRRWAHATWALLRSSGQGVALASALAPMMAFAAAKAPERYSDNLLPIAGLLMVRGAATLVAGLSSAARFVARLAPFRGRLEVGLGLVLAAAWIVGEWREPHQRSAVLAPGFERQALPVGRALALHFPSGGGAASCLREVLPYAGMRYCPNTTCPFSDDESGYRRCIAIIRQECAGSGDIPLVVTDALTPEQCPPNRVHFEAWVESLLEPVATVGGSRIYAIPRSGDL